MYINAHATYISSVRQLYLSMNNYSEVELPETPIQFPSVEELYFSKNLVTDWTELRKLGQIFPSVTSLILINVPIDTLGEDRMVDFHRLKKLNLTGCGLCEWEQLEKVNGLPELTDIRVKGLPWLEVHICIWCAVTVMLAVPS